MKKLTKKKIETITIEPLFKIGDVVILKDNLLAVEIGEVFIKAKRYCYRVRYNHKYYENKLIGWFYAFEDELDIKPLDYESLLMEKYIDYKCKYKHLVFELTGGNKAKRKSREELL